MNDFFSQESSAENHITEIKTPAKAAKKPKARLSFGSFIALLLVCIIVSSASGAGGAFFMYSLLTPDTEESTGQEFVIDELTTAAQTAESITAAPDNSDTPSEDIIIPPSTSPYTDTPYEETTIMAALTKGDIYARAVNSIVTIKASWKQYYSSILGSYYRPATSSGTGFIISENGYIITNHHVIENAEEISITDYSGKEYTARVVGTEPSNDIAIIKIDAATTPVDLGNSADLKVGDDIMIIGNALGELSYTFTDGIVSHLSRRIVVESGIELNVFQTNAAINNGNSGGPVYNMDGKVVGIASAKYASEKIEGLGFCIPIDDVKQMMTDIIVYGYVKGKPTLGVSVQTVTSSMSSRYSIPTGCYIVALEKNSSCYEAGVRSGDVITKLGDKAISSAEDMSSALSDKKAGERISITYCSQGETKSTVVTINEYKPSDPRTNYSNVYDF